MNLAIAHRLNHDCFCITLDREALHSGLEEALAHEAGGPQFAAGVLASRPHLFSSVPVFLPQRALAAMGAIVEAIEAASRLPAYREAVLARAPAIARHDHGPAGALMGYDFHLGDDGPRLIEVNTNAGGALLNALLGRAQRACCPEIEPALAAVMDGEFEARVAAMFASEWRRQRGGEGLSTIAIVDDRPAEQYLYPEFVLARELFRRHGYQAVIADAADLRYEKARLLAGGDPVDLVYNRLVDFALERPEHAALRAAYGDGAVVLTPNPHTHALLADKRNLALLCDPQTLAAQGLAPHHAAALAGIPRTVPVTPANAEALWRSRKDLYFKPACGHAGKAVYRGGKLTRGVWAAIVQGGYVAQALVAPGERMIEIDGAPVPRKLDVRLYTHDGTVLAAAARLYQGQTTNFRTPGGGFAPVLVI